MEYKREIQIKVTREYFGTLHRWVTVKHYLCW